MHTSGLQGEPPWQDLDRMWMYRPEDLLAALSFARVATPPEVDHKYSNLGFELLGHVVARVAGRPFDAYVRAEILDPLGMADTVLTPNADQLERKAVGYDARSHDDHPTLARDVDSQFFAADGGLWSTLEDLGRWLGQQLRTDAALERGEGQVLRGRTLTEMHRPSFVVDAAWKEAQGLCWYGTRSGETIVPRALRAPCGGSARTSRSCRRPASGRSCCSTGSGPRTRSRWSSSRRSCRRSGKPRTEPRSRAYVPMPEAYRELRRELPGSGVR